MADAKDKLKARGRLALRAERAFGLESVPAANNEVALSEAQSERPAAGRPVLSSVRPTSARPTTAPPRIVTPPPPPQRMTAPPSAQPVVAKQQVDRPGAAPAPAAVQLSLAQGPFTSAELSTDEKIKRLRELDENEVRGCPKCRLCETRTNTVFGEGSAEAKLMFIGEGPGENEDLTGRPFVGKAGQLLDRQIAAMGLKREEVFIANIVKCRPPENRAPAPDEVSACTPYLDRQIEIIRPRVIVTLGLPAATHMLKLKSSMGNLRGRWHEWRGIKLMPTFHPAYLLRVHTLENRRMVWDDLQQVMRELDLAPAKRTES